MSQLLRSFSKLFRSSVVDIRWPGLEVGKNVNMLMFLESLLLSKKTSWTLHRYFQYFRLLRGSPKLPELLEARP